MMPDQQTERTTAHPYDGVAWFASIMRMKFDENAHKRGWDRIDREYALYRMRQETREIAEAIDQRSDSPSTSDNDSMRVAIARECADVANFAMMLAWAEAHGIEDGERLASEGAFDGWRVYRMNEYDFVCARGAFEAVRWYVHHSGHSVVADSIAEDAGELTYQDLKLFVWEDRDGVFVEEGSTISFADALSEMLRHGWAKSGEPFIFASTEF